MGVGLSDDWALRFSGQCRKVKGLSFLCPCPGSDTGAVLPLLSGLASQRNSSLALGQEPDTVVLAAKSMEQRHSFSSALGKVSLGPNPGNLPSEGLRRQEPA